MTVKLRLMRMGKKKQPTYRIVASDSRSPRDGRFIEIVGTYAPRSEPSVVLVDNARAVRWLSQGAQPTDTVRKLLAISGAWTEFEAQTGRPHAAATTVRAPVPKPVPKPSGKAAEKPEAAGPVKEAVAEVVELLVEEAVDLTAEIVEAAAQAGAEAKVEGTEAAGDAGAGEG